MISGWRCTKKVANFSLLQTPLVEDVAIETVAVAAVAVEGMEVVQARTPATTLFHPRRTLKSSVRYARRLAMKLLVAGTAMMVMKRINPTTRRQELLLQDMAMTRTGTRTVELQIMLLVIRRSSRFVTSTQAVINYIQQVEQV
jgi:hypothetical protein